MRPLRQAPGSSRTTTLPIRKRASATVSAGSSSRRRRRTEMGAWRGVTSKRGSPPRRCGSPILRPGRLPRNPQETRFGRKLRRFLDLAGERLNNEDSMSVRAGGAEDMFLDVKDLAVRKLPIRKSYAPGSIDYQTAEIKQGDPLEVNATAELLDGHIRIAGDIETKVELVCARCLEPVAEEVSQTFHLFYTPLPTRVKPTKTPL